MRGPKGNDVRAWTLPDSIRASRLTGMMMGTGVATRSRRGQTRVESSVALAVLIIAGVGAWMLYKDSIVETTRAMIGFFTSSDSS